MLRNPQLACHSGGSAHVVHSSKPFTSIPCRKRVHLICSGALSDSPASQCAHRAATHIGLVPEVQQQAAKTAAPSTMGKSARYVQEIVLLAAAQGTAANKQQSSKFPVYLGVAAIAVGVVVWTYRTFLTGAATHAASSVADGLHQKKLQREAAARLNDMSSLLTNSPTADLSAKNLGDEGAAYVVEALAFNTVCLAADLSNNGIGRLGMAQLSEVLPTCALQHLKLHTNNIGDDGSALIAQKLSSNSLLLSLDLGANGIGDVGAAAIAEGLKLNTTLQRLDLSGNAIDKAGAKALADALAVNNTLVSLVLNDNYIGSEGAKALAEALLANKSLVELSIKGNELGDEGVEALATALLSREAPLRLLDIGNNSLSPAAAEPLARLLHGKAEKLVEFNMYMNEIGDKGMSKLAPAFKECKVLKNLDLGGNDAGPEAATALAEALLSHPSLQMLELGYNPLGPAGAAIIAGAFKHDSKVETLKLGWCKLGGGDGARAVADLLMFNNSLVQLDLRGNGLGNDGAIIISRGMRSAESKQLAELDLGYNEIKDDGACALAQALKANADCAVKELKLNANYITRFGQVALTEAVDMVYEMGGGNILTVTF